MVYLLPPTSLHRVSEDAPILLDVTRLIWRRWRGRKPTGIDRVCLAYLQHFASSAQAVIQHDRFRRIIDRRPSRALFAMLENPGPSFKLDLVLWSLRNLGRWSNEGRGRYYLNIGHTGLDSPGFGKWVHDAQVKPVYFVHDLIPITHPGYCRSGEDEKHRQRMRTVLTTASGVIGNSQATLDELAAFARSEGLPVPAGIAAWLGTDPFPQTSPRSAPAKPTFVTVGTIEARKNHQLLLDVWSRLIERLGDDAPRLLIIGQRGWEADEVFERLKCDHSLSGHVVEMNNCSDEDLGRHLATSRALLFPSHLEGFGLPLIEAFTLGVPVIASDLPVFREIGADIPSYIDATNTDAWYDEILAYSAEPSAPREAQLRRMKSFSPPDWDSHFRLVERWLPLLHTAA